jgi:hypothetical protein
MSGILWRKLFMKRLFFVLLFALTALFFLGCSSSGGGGGGNGGGPIEGNVIIPSDYSTDAVYVCSDADRSNSCSDTETYVKANSDGSFTITANANFPLVAEFYATDPFPSSGASVSSLGGATPRFVYTSPAGKTTISTFTTLVKNKVDLNPTMTVGAATTEVAGASGITDPFDAESYTGNAMAVHDVVTELIEGVLDLIKGKGHEVDESPAIVAALYTIIFDLLVDENIADDPAGVVVGDLVSGVEGDIEQTIEDAEATLEGAASSETWDPNATFTLYQIGHDDGDLTMQAYRTGPTWTEYEEESISDLGSNLPPTSGSSESFSLAEQGNIVEKAVKTSPGSVVTSERFRSRTIPFTSAGAEVYTLLVALQDKASRDSFDSLRAKYGTRNMGENTSWFGGVTINPTGSNNYEINMNNAGYITMNETNKTFHWDYTHENDVFPSNSQFHEEGHYTHENEGTNAETYMFTANNGSVAKVFHPDSDPSRFIMALYPVRESMVFFNAAAAGDIREWLKVNSITPIY